MKESQKVQQNVEKNLDKQFSDATVTPDRSKTDILLAPGNIMAFHSAPPTPHNQTFSHKLEAASVSAPGTPGNRQNTDPPEVNRLYMKAPGYRGGSLTDLSNGSRDSAFESVKNSPLSPEPFLMSPSAFQTIEKPSSKSLGAIGSGVPQRSQESSILESLTHLNIGDNRPQNHSANPRLAPGNGAGLRPTRTAADSPSAPVSSLINPLQQLANQQQHHNQQSNAHSQAPSQQQQLLQAQRRAQIQQAQLLQQQKLREIANQANTSSQNQAGIQQLYSVIIELL